VHHSIAFCLKGLRPRQNSSLAQISHKQTINKFLPSESALRPRLLARWFETRCFAGCGMVVRHD
jgi:hypothetical protein